MTRLVTRLVPSDKMAVSHQITLMHSISTGKVGVHGMPGDREKYTPTQGDRDTLSASGGARTECVDTSVPMKDRQHGPKW